jgi:hypothetical protein
MTTKRLQLGALALSALLGACNGTETPMETETATRFQVRIENVSNVFDFLDSGVFNTPEGSAGPGPLAGGSAYSFTFSAAPGHLLSFATMFVQSNDLFYAPSGAGIALYDEGGNPRSGDVTNEVMLWDSGTEMDQEPGLGPDQAPRQGGAASGTADANTAVRVADDTFGNLPATMAAIRVTLTYLGGGEFNVRIENMATDLMIATSDAGMAPILLAPGVYTVGAATDALFTAGSADRGEGLKALAEDGDPSGLGAMLAGRSGLTSPLAPGVWAVHSAGEAIFSNGMADRGQGLEALAEDGDPSGLAASLSGGIILSSGVFNTPDGTAGPGPLFPGQAYVAEFEANPGDFLSLATMFVQTNDLFFAPAAGGLTLFNGSSPVSGDITSQFLLWDAGTEVNQIPGVGMDQAPRQAGANTGAMESGFVRAANDGFLYPNVESVLRVTLIPIS